MVVAKYLSGLALMVTVIGAPPLAAQTNNPDTDWLNAFSAALDIVDRDERLAELHRIADRVAEEFGETSLEFAEAQMQIGVELHGECMRQESIAYILRSAQINAHILGNESPVVATAYHSLADAEASIAEDRYSAEAEQAARIALDIRQRIMEPDAPERLQIASVLGQILTLRGDQAAFAEARTLLRYAVNGFEASVDENAGEYSDAYLGLVELELAAGQPEAALAVLDEGAQTTANAPFAFFDDGRRLDLAERALRQMGRISEANELRENFGEYIAADTVFDELGNMCLP